MIKHYIIMSSSYTDGSRVALDITEDCFLNSKAIAEMIEEIRKNCGKDVPLSTHFIETESASWDSVVAYDPFFEEFGDDSDIRTGVKELPARSRILFAKEGTEKLSSIDRTIAKYGKYSAGALVDLTHRAGTPWSYVDSSVAYQEISDNLIMAYHHVESV